MGCGTRHDFGCMQRVPLASRQCSSRTRVRPKHGQDARGTQRQCSSETRVGQKDGQDALTARKSKIGLFFIESIQKQFRKIMEKSGLLFNEHIPFPSLAEAGHKYVSYNCFTESSTTVGRYICSVESGLYDGLVNLGSFNCQPAMNSQVIIRPLASKSNIAYASLDCEGPWISTNQRRLLESIAVQEKRIKSAKINKRLTEDPIEYDV